MRALKIKKPAKWVVLYVFILSGCANANPQSSPAQDALYSDNGNASKDADAGSNFDNLDLVDAGLKGKVAVMRVGSQLADNNLLSVFAGLKNRTEHRLDLEVETIYKDKAGNALNAGSWILVSLKAHQDQEYRSTSISSDAVDFLIRVRRAKKSK
jgi:hypothetical protein